MAQFQKRVNIEVIDANNGQFCKIACMSCIRGHRTTSCGIANCRNKVFWTVKRPGRPSNTCNCAMVGGVCICTLSVPICPHKAKRGGKRSVDCRCDEQGRFCCYVTEADWDALSAGIKPRIQFFENREDLRADGDKRSNSHALVPSYRPSDPGQNGSLAPEDPANSLGDKIPIMRQSMPPRFGFMGVGAAMSSKGRFGEDVFQWDSTPPAPRHTASYHQAFEGPRNGSHSSAVTDSSASLMTLTGEPDSQQPAHQPTPNSDHSGASLPAAYLQHYPFAMQRAPLQQPPQAQVNPNHMHDLQLQPAVGPQHVPPAADHHLDVAQSHYSDTTTTGSNELVSPTSNNLAIPEGVAISSCCNGSGEGPRSPLWRPEIVQHTNGHDNDDLDAFMQQYVLNQAPGAMCQQCGRRNCSCSMCPPVMQTGGTSNWGVCGRAHERYPHTMQHASIPEAAEPIHPQRSDELPQDGYSHNSVTLQYPHTCCQETFLQPQYIDPSNLTTDLQEPQYQQRHDSQQQSSIVRSASVLEQFPALTMSEERQASTTQRQDSTAEMVFSAQLFDIQREGYTYLEVD